MHSGGEMPNLMFSLRPPALPPVHTRRHLRIPSLRARSVCVDSPVCPMPCVCFVITMLTVFPWQCASDDTQTHAALKAHIIFYTHNRNILTYTHTFRFKQPQTSFRNTQLPVASNQIPPVIKNNSIKIIVYYSKGNNVVCIKNIITSPTLFFVMFWFSVREGNTFMLEIAQFWVKRKVWYESIVSSAQPLIKRDFNHFECNLKKKY